MAEVITPATLNACLNPCSRTICNFRELSNCRNKLLGEAHAARAEYSTKKRDGSGT